MDSSEFIERLGIQFEENGLPRIAGRIFGLLMVTPEPLSLDEMANSLAVSKASVSNDARLLARLGIIELVSRTGDRRDYYRMAADSFARSMRLRLESIRNLHALLAAGLQSNLSQDPDIQRRLAAFEADSSEMIRILEEGISRSSARAHRVT